MERIPIKVGTKLTLTFKQPGKQPEEYHCKVIDLKENYMILDDPVHKTTKKSKYFPVGTAFSVIYAGSDQGIYQFHTKIAARVKLKFPAFAILMPTKEEVQKIQRRQFVRIEATVDIAVHRQTGEHQAFATVTSDISGGGLSLVVPNNRNLELNEMIDIWLILGFQSGKFHYVYTKAQVVFTKLENGVHSASVKFISIKPTDQQLIISYCFEKQREMRKKELT